MHQNDSPTHEIDTENEEIPADETVEKTSTDDLLARLEEAEKKERENEDKLLRIYAEFENYKKRIAKEKTEFIEFAHENFIKEVIPIIDNLERSIDHGEHADKDSIIQGIKMILDQFFKIFSQFDIFPFSALGEKFDPKRHEAIMHIESSDHEENTVIS